MPRVEPLVLPIEIDEVSLDLVGGKARSLAKLATASFSVPPGFILSTVAYNSFTEVNELSDAIFHAIAGIAFDQAARLEDASSAIQERFEKAGMSSEIAAAIIKAYAGLGENCAVAVRSSATAEDLPLLSFAGQQDTYLNVVGEEALLNAVKRCWASLWSARAIGYRLRLDIDQRAIAMGIVIQAMVQSDVSGIAFTANPTTGDRSEIVVNASFGLGDAIVSGLVTPDTYVVDRVSLQTKERIIGAKEKMLLSNGTGGLVSQTVEAEKRAESSLTDEMLLRLAKLSLEIEQLFEGVPQDIEWAVSDGNIHVLQSRPITHLPPNPLTEVVWKPEYPGGKLIRRQVVENMPDPLSPLFSELYLEVGLEHSIDQLMKVWDAPFDMSAFITRPFFVTVNGYAYCRADYKIPWGKLGKMFRWMFKTMPRMMRDIIPQWEQDGLPTYLATVASYKSININITSDEQLLTAIRALTIADADYWFRVSIVMGMAKMTDGALHVFLSLLVKGDLISGMFLRGFASKTLQAQLELESIARRIQASASLRDLVIATPATRLIEVLATQDEGAAIVASIETYLGKYGHRIYTLDFVQETQKENPLPVLLSLKVLVEDATYDTNLRQADIARDRQLLEQRTLASIGPMRRWIFRKLLAWAQTYGPYREEALFYMGAAWPTLRKLARELGKRLVEAGLLQNPDDVFYLRTEELNRACQAREAGSVIAELAPLVNERMALRESRKQLHPPPMVPEGRFKIGFLDLSFFETQKRNKPDSNVLKGFAVSPGKVTGVATVILSPADFELMQPGTILVCPTTTPAWTPLFSQALALVTDIGGILAHGSIVAREYGIPAVMGTGNITQRIVTGQQIMVDGEAGSVTILDVSVDHSMRKLGCVDGHPSSDS